MILCSHGFLPPPLSSIFHLPASCFLLPASCFPASCFPASLSRKADKPNTTLVNRNVGAALAFVERVDACLRYFEETVGDPPPGGRSQVAPIVEEAKQ